MKMFFFGVASDTESRQIVINSGNVKKMWQTGRDGRSCPGCK